MAAVPKPGGIPLDEATPQQLKEYGQTLEQRCEYLASAMKSLRYAQDQFVGARTALNDLAASEGKPMLVPLTGSIYIPGQLESHGRVKVAVGASYFIEKDVDGAKEFFDRRVDYLKLRMEEIQPVLMAASVERQVVNARAQQVREQQVAAQRSAVAAATAQ